MRILFLTSRLPAPPTRGDRLRVFHFLRELARDHRITLLSFVASNDEQAHLAELRPYCEDIHLVHLSRARSLLSATAGVWRPEPLQASYYRSAAMQAAVDDLVARGRFDLLYVHLFRMAPYGLKHQSLYRVLDLTDVISAEIARALPYHPPHWRAVYRTELTRIQRYEQALVNRFDETWVISETERMTLAAFGASRPIVVVPNGVDGQRFHPTGQPRDAATLLFVGHMGVPHNVDAAEYLATEVYPLIRREVPAARLELVGAEPSARVRKLDELPGVTVRGHVHDLNAVLNQATVFVAPLRFAAGVQNKVLEAMAAGTPVVTTRIVAAGLGAEQGTHLLVADDATGLARQTMTLIRNAPNAGELASAARQFVLSTFRWDAVSRRVAALESEGLGRSSAKS